MANYNPHAPQNIGQEWVPIRDEGLVYNPYANSFERGYGFSLAAARNVSNVRAYVNTMPNQFIMDRAFTASIYPRDYEDQSGPVRRVIIPCTSGIITGADPSSWSFIAVSDVASAFFNPSAQQAITYRVGFTYGSDTYMFFGVSQYQNLLQNKRILGVNFLTSIDIGTATANTQENMQLWMANDNAIVQNPGGGGFVFDNAGAIRYPNLATPTTPSTDVRFDRIRLGDVARFQGTTGFNVATPNMSVTQWTYNELARFEASASNRINMAFHIPIAGVQFGFSTVIVSYAALEVYYCEEARVGFGTRLVQVNNQNNYWPGNYIGVGAMPISVFTPAAAPLILQPGDYTVTLSESNFGDSYNGLRTPGRFPIFNENRQLYEIPTVPGVEIAIPFPLNDEAINQTFTSTETVLIPQLSLHASGASGTLFESHPYGRQTMGEVIDSSTLFVRQRVDTSFIGPSLSPSYPWIRYWARRYGDTTGSLIATLGSSVASISVADLDALDEIVDGWREVTLRFNTPATLSPLSYPTIDWTPSVSQNRGNRWEVLGAGAPALTGIPGASTLTQVASPHTLTIATYGQPVSGGLISESWRPQLGPYVSSASFDVISDVSFILAQDAPAVSGFGVTVASMAVTGIGQQCGINPCCIPTAILYNRLSWSSMGSALSLPGTSGNYASTPDNAALDILGDIDLRADVTLDDWTTALPQVLVAKYNATTNQRSYRFEANEFGTLGLFTSTNGTAFINPMSTASPIPSSTSGRLAVRVTLDVDNGAAGNTATFYTAPTIDGPWTQLGAPVVTAGVTSIFNSTAPLEVGSSNVGTANLAAGVVHAVQVRNLIDGTIVANPNFSAQTPGATSFTDSAGRVWTINGTASIIPYAPLNIPTLELQRSDAINSTWNTIMRSNTTVTLFNDYEARVGLSSSYRIRSIDVNDFPGPWSSTVSIIPPSPGVSGGCVQDGHILIFTTNEIQDGSSNLAYSSAWMDTQVVEDIGFTEAGFVQMQAMYNRDFFTAFRPNERGGERFSRTVLVQAAAISPPTVGNFTSLRDMAWDNVSYICVRDEDGNRWFATVLVPSGRILKNRTLYLAPVDIIEVTDTPSEVNP